ncbi:hypothetical protein [Flavobacterium reichenbachii]|uniref:hypothetical protein n=1 Tax=Flavobacterium reichenbachii TaxID=362418 RepID=UPI000AAFDA43|nr:hypothetical protein [Flavobacterium reichenbachii]
MTFQNYFYQPEHSTENTISYEEQLLLHHDDYLEDGFANKLEPHPLYTIELGDLGF